MTDFKIAYDGTWYHGGARIQREALAKLFSDRALAVDGEGRYWLQTPFEKYPVEVEDVPYVIIDYVENDTGLNFITNMGEQVELGPGHPLVLRPDRTTGDSVPYIEVRKGLYARLGRSVYYNLINRFGPSVKSRGGEYKLGNVDA